MSLFARWGASASGIAKFPLLQVENKKSQNSLLTCLTAVYAARHVSARVEVYGPIASSRLILTRRVQLGHNTSRSAPQ